MRLSQTAFATRLGLTRQAVYYLERGERQPSKTLRILLGFVADEHARDNEG